MCFGVIGPGDRKSVRRWRRGWRQVNMTNCTISSLMVSGTRRRWNQNCSQADRLVGQGSEVPVMVWHCVSSFRKDEQPVRLGTKGRLKARFAAVRIRIADEPRSGSRKGSTTYFPGEEARLIGGIATRGRRSIISQIC